MLARGLDCTSRCINNWEHLCMELKAPLEIRLRCKLNNEYSCTEMLIGFMAAEMGTKTVQDLIAALNADPVMRPDVVKIITDVYPGMFKLSVYNLYLELCRYIDTDTLKIMRNYTFLCSEITHAIGHKHLVLL